MPHSHVSHKKISYYSYYLGNFIALPVMILLVGSYAIIIEGYWPLNDFEKNIFSISFCYMVIYPSFKTIIIRNKKEDKIIFQWVLFGYIILRKRSILIKNLSYKSKRIVNSSENGGSTVTWRRILKENNRVILKFNGGISDLNNLIPELTKNDSISEVDLSIPDTLSKHIPPSGMNGISSMPLDEFQENIGINSELDLPSNYDSSKTDTDDLEVESEDLRVDDSNWWDEK